jgi:oxygen-independent coproporphyrinogen-3 oxidase
MLGLYLHVPYCRALCHYCDFAKTANVTPGVAAAYLGRLGGHLAAWLERPELAAARLAAGGRFTSVFFGGGTPSLYAAEYAPILARLAPLLAPEAELTLEANPDDVTPARLDLWRRLGFNRLSLGVQTFDPAGLRFLKRIHGPEAARDAALAAVATFPSVNVDLIYGWPGQTEASWDKDLELAVALGAGHLSLYTLTYEPRTPIGRAEARGRVIKAEDDRVADLYDHARRQLAAAGFAQEEVSNWARPGQSCRHNWLYWSDSPYLGVGAGAHGYFPDPGGPGLRYAYGRSDRAFLKAVPGVGDLGEAFGVAVEPRRTFEAWLTELVGASLRTTRGVSLGSALARGRKALEPTPALARGMDEGIISLDDGTLKLDPGEWFRETSWAVEVLESIV